MPDRDPAPQSAAERLAALSERLRAQVEKEPTDAEVEREAAELRGRPQMFRPPPRRR